MNFKVIMHWRFLINWPPSQRTMSSPRREAGGSLVNVHDSDPLRVPTEILAGEGTGSSISPGCLDRARIKGVSEVLSSVHISHPSEQCFQNRIMSGFKPNSVPTTLQPIHLRTCQRNSLFSPPKFLLGIILLPQKKKKKLKNASVEVTAPVRRATRALGQEVVALPALVQKTKQRHQTEGLWESQSPADVGPIFSNSSGPCPRVSEAWLAVGLLFEH